MGGEEGRGLLYYCMYLLTVDLLIRFVLSPLISSSFSNSPPCIDWYILWRTVEFGMNGFCTLLQKDAQVCTCESYPQDCVVFWQVHVMGNEYISLVQMMELPRAGHSCCATLVIQEHRPYQSPAWDLQWMAQDIQTVNIAIVPGWMDCLSS